MFETVSVTFLGLWFSYFTSFIVGYLPSLISGTFFSFYFLVGPYGKAVFRNLEDGASGMEGGGGGGKDYMFVGVIDSLSLLPTPTSSRPLKVTPGTSDSSLRGTTLRLKITDSSNRELSTSVLYHPRYRDVIPGDVCYVVVKEGGEGVVSGDVWVEGKDIWIGDWPRTDRRVMEGMWEEEEWEYEGEREKEYWMERRTG